MENNLTWKAILWYSDRIEFEDKISLNVQNENSDEALNTAIFQFLEIKNRNDIHSVSILQKVRIFSEYKEYKIWRTTKGQFSHRIWTKVHPEENKSYYQSNLDGKRTKDKNGSSQKQYDYIEQNRKIKLNGTNFQMTVRNIIDYNKYHQAHIVDYILVDVLSNHKNK